MLHLTITTVERQLIDEPEAMQVTIPTTDGIITVLPGHTPLMTTLAMGEVIVQRSGQENLVLFVNGGTAQIDQDRVELLARMAERADELDEARIEEAKRRAEKLLTEQPIDVDLAQVEKALQQELMKQKVVRKWKNVGQTPSETSV